MLMGVTDYARHRGLNLSTVQYAVQKGRIKRDPNGLIDSVQADIDWEKNTRFHHRASKPHKVVEPVAGEEPIDPGQAAGPVPGPGQTYPAADPIDPAAAAAPANGRILGGRYQTITAAARRGEIPGAGGATAGPTITAPDYNRARAAKEIYEARLKQLEYEERRGNLVSRKDVEMHAYNRARVLRDALSNVPVRLAAQLAAETDAHIVHDVLLAELRTVLEKFAGGPPA
jgi:hypothetical protein